MAFSIAEALSSISRTNPGRDAVRVLWTELLFLWWDLRRPQSHRPQVWPV